MARSRTQCPGPWSEFFPLPYMGIRGLPLCQETRMSGNRPKPAATALVLLRHFSVFPVNTESHFWLTATWGTAAKQQHVLAINCSSPTGYLLPQGYSLGHTTNEVYTLPANLPSRVKWAVDRAGEYASSITTPFAWNEYLLNAVHMPGTVQATIVVFISLNSHHSFMNY